MPAEDYYALLSVPRNANLRQIETAYRAQRAKAQADQPKLDSIERAYAVLRDPNLKRKYDSELLEGRIALAVEREAQAARDKAQEAAAQPSRQASQPLLTPQHKRLLAGVLLAALLVAVVTQVWPFIAWRFVAHEEGNQLYLENGEAFGEVIEYQSAHEFPRGIVKPAYRIRKPDGREVWMTASEVNQLTRKGRKR